MCRKSCSCAQRMQRRHCMNWVLAATSHRSLSAYLLASSTFPPSLRASTSASSWTHSYDAYETKTPASPLLVRQWSYLSLWYEFIHIKTLVWIKVLHNEVIWQVAIKIYIVLSPQVVSGKCKYSQQWPTLSTPSTLMCPALLCRNWLHQNLLSPRLPWRGLSALGAASAASHDLRSRG